MVIGAKVTLRGQRMYDFLEKLISSTMPRLRDFYGLDPKGGFDGQGNYILGFKEHIVFPEIGMEDVDKTHGLEVAINTSASVTGSLPILGAQHTINNSLTIGTATVNKSSFDPDNSGSQPIGTTGFRFSGVRLTAGSAEDMTFKSIRWNQTGSLGSTDLANLVTVVNGTSYPTVVSSDGKYYTTIFPAGIVVAKGMSVDAYIQGDIVGSGAAGRTAEFDIYKSTDVYLTGNLYGYGIIMSGNFGTWSSAATHGSAADSSKNPYFQGSTLAITAGSVTLISKANEVAAQNIAVNVNDQVLGGFATNFNGEAVSVQSMIFTVSTSSGSIGDVLTNVKLVDSNGAVVAGPVDAEWVNSRL
jgi:hypothetical protein